jgi:hypothetical protein
MSKNIGKCLMIVCVWYGRWVYPNSADGDTQVEWMVAWSALQHVCLHSFGDWHNDPSSPPNNQDT